MSAPEQGSPAANKARFFSADPVVQDKARALGWQLRLPAVKYGVFLFSRGRKRVWEHLSGATCAEIVHGTQDASGCYENHRQYPTLLVALEVEGAKRKELQAAGV